MSACLGIAEAQNEPRSLDDQLRETISLGDAGGCLAFLGFDPSLPPEPSQLDEVLDALETQNQLGKELAAICNRSAVTSASGLGGGLDTVQATKTVSQFRLARRRIDRRLSAPPSPPPGGQRLFGRPQDGGFGAELALGPGRGLALFAGFEREWRDRDTTPYDQGYASDIYGASFGADYAWDRAVLGGWGGFARTTGDLDPVRPLVVSPGGFVNEQATDFLSDPTTASAACGGISGGGNFTENSRRLGVFAGWTPDRAGFVDVSLGLDRRTHDYTRNVCMIKVAGDPLALAVGVPFRILNSNLIVDDIEIDAVNHPPVNVLYIDFNEDGFGESDTINDDVYAGMISGRAPIRELALSLRGGYNFELREGAWTLGPRAVLTLARTTVDDYLETGSSTVASDIIRFDRSNVTRALGDPIGLELAYDERTHGVRTLEIGGEAAHRLAFEGGALIPHASAYWRRQLRTGFIEQTARLAQDRRPEPVRFSFVNDGPDTHDLIVSGGVSALLGDHAMARFEVNYLALNAFVRSKGFAAQLRWRL